MLCWHLRSRFLQAGVCESQKMFGSEPCELCELQPTTLSLFSMLQPPGLQVNSSTLRGSVLAGSCAQNCNNSKQFQEWHLSCAQRLSMTATYLHKCSIAPSVNKSGDACLLWVVLEAGFSRRWYSLLLVCELHNCYDLQKCKGSKRR